MFVFSLSVTVNGGVTLLTGSTGDIKSINYPDHYYYPQEYTHTWRITGDLTDKRIGLIFKDFNTEPCCDKVTVRVVTLVYILLFIILLYKHSRMKLSLLVQWGDNSYALLSLST